jgi:hypothetical protein
MSALLTDEEVAQLTGYKRGALQAAWLLEHGIKHWRNACGRPVVPRSAIDGGPEVEGPTWTPDFSRLRV